MDDRRETVLRSIEDQKGELIGFLQMLVRAPSMFGSERQAQDIVAGKLRDIGMRVDVWEPNRKELSKHPAYTETPRDYASRPDVVGLMKGLGGGQSLILNGHIDVVSPEPVSAWKFDPWAATVKDGRMYGRGACDMKGGMAAAIYAIKALSENHVPLRGDVILESVIEEEIGGPGGTLATLLRGYRADAALLAEPFKKICVGSAGVCWFRVRVTGKTEHAARSHLGVNAIGKVSKIYDALLALDLHRAETKRYPLAEKYWGRSTNLNIGTIRGGDWPSTVAGWAEIECRIGWQPIETMDQVKAEVEETVRKTAESDDWMRDHPPSLEWFGWKAEASETDIGSPIINVLQRNANQLLGSEPEIVGTSAADDTRWFVLYANTPAVTLGPDGDNIHGIDEYVLVDDVVTMAKIYALTILDWCK